MPIVGSTLVAYWWIPPLTLCTSLKPHFDTKNWATLILRIPYYYYYYNYYYEKEVNDNVDNIVYIDDSSSIPWWHIHIVGLVGSSKIPVSTLPPHSLAVDSGRLSTSLYGSFATSNSVSSRRSKVDTIVAMLWL